jgi:1-deoxy-D-xylulose-5-phosphate reductoisomerase
MKKNIAIIGSTGSIGTQALEVIAHFPDRFSVCGLAARRDHALLSRQIEQFHPREAALFEEEPYRKLCERWQGFPIALWKGQEGCRRIASLEDVHLCLISTVGISGLLPAMEAIEQGKTVALATKEALVAAGSLVMKRVKEKKAELIPVDSEHSALFQCLQGAGKGEIQKLILTSSGGPFRGASPGELKDVMPDEALAHPTWKMGKKITIDSATLMNKGFEVIEAHHLFGVSLDRIEVLVHRQSVIHSLVEFVDGSTLAQLSPPDMRLPIQYALGYPERLHKSWQTLDLPALGSFTFEKPDMETFRALALAYEACRAGGTMPAVLNGANEVAVEAFLSGDIGFTDIAEIVEKTMEAHAIKEYHDLLEVMEADRWAQEYTQRLVAQRRASSKGASQERSGVV